MEKITVDTQHHFIPEALGITNDRFKQLDLKMKMMIHELSAPIKGSKKPRFGAVDIIQKFASLAKDEKELAFVMFVAGRFTEKIFD